MEKLEPILAERLTTIYTQLKNGKDVSPTYRLRTEGMLELAVTMGWLTKASALALVAECHHSVLDDRLVLHDPSWNFTVPVAQQKAPVYPTTR